eukprot:TRINITY_DN9561_c0_g1_i1.p1 TRINITY_DN9561_c0_g1~~TRINITY_DN9561_c0_g1_i1.p1  ORF type:complete len:840 (-),score=161.67 TRINITY_DN9561_c0_g1_i1:52-2469(-)
MDEKNVFGVNLKLKKNVCVRVTNQRQIVKLTQQIMQGSSIIYLTVLHMNNICDGIGDTGAAMLADAITCASCAVEILDLSMNRIGNVGARQLIISLNSNQTLRNLNLSFNRISHVDVTSTTRLEILDLRWNFLPQGNLSKLVSLSSWSFDVRVDPQSIPTGSVLHSGCDFGNWTQVDSSANWIFEGNFDLNGWKKQGKLICKNGVTYTGEFLNDVPCGSGMKSRPDGLRVQGSFQDGIEHGMMEIVYSEGVQFKGLFRKGSIVSKGGFVKDVGLLCELESLIPQTSRLATLLERCGLVSLTKVVPDGKKFDKLTTSPFLLIVETEDGVVLGGFHTDAAKDAPFCLFRICSKGRIADFKEYPYKYSGVYGQAFSTSLTQISFGNHELSIPFPGSYGDVHATYVQGSKFFSDGTHLFDAPLNRKPKIVEIFELSTSPWPDQFSGIPGPVHVESGCPFDSVVLCKWRSPRFLSWFREAVETTIVSTDGKLTEYWFEIDDTSSFVFIVFQQKEFLIHNLVQGIQIPGCPLKVICSETIEFSKTPSLMERRDHLRCIPKTCDLGRIIEGSRIILQANVNATDQLKKSVENTRSQILLLLNFDSVVVGWFKNSSWPINTLDKSFPQQGDILFASTRRKYNRGGMMLLLTVESKEDFSEEDCFKLVLNHPESPTFFIPRRILEFRPDILQQANQFSLSCVDVLTFGKRIPLSKAKVKLNTTYNIEYGQVNWILISVYDDDGNLLPELPVDTKISISIVDWWEGHESNPSYTISKVEEGFLVEYTPWMRGPQATISVSIGDHLPGSPFSLACG